MICYTHISCGCPWFLSSQFYFMYFRMTSLTKVFISPTFCSCSCRAEVHWHRSPLLLSAELDRLSDPAHGRGPWPHVCGQQRLHPLSGSARHQQGAAHSKTCPTKTHSKTGSAQNNFKANHYFPPPPPSDPLACCPAEEDWMCFVRKRHECKYSNKVM